MIDPLHQLMNMCRCQIIRFLVGVFLSCTLTHAVAQIDTHTEEAPYLYTVKSGDTLSLISQKYLLDGALIYLLQANTGINKNELKVGQIISIPRRLIRYSESHAVVAYLKCSSSVAVLQNSEVLKKERKIAQGDVIYVPAQCDLSFQFEDHSVVRMPSGGNIKINVLRKSPLEKSPEVQLSLIDGRVEVKVPKRQAGDAPFGINTPNSVAGVRGTEFRVGFNKDSGVGVVEVSSGLIAAKGVADLISSSVSTQKGMVIPSQGLANQVESLPEPIIFLSAQIQQNPNWILFVFHAGSNSQNYYLREQRYINAGGVQGLKQSEPLFLTSHLRSVAKMLTWTAQTSSGLRGDERHYGICANQQISSLGRCSVIFDLNQLDKPVLSLIQEGAQNTGVEILKEYRPQGDPKDLIVRGLPAGKYRWEIQSVLNGGLLTKQEGRFELIVVNQP